MEARNEIERVSILAMDGSALATDTDGELSAAFSELLEALGECKRSSDAACIQGSPERVADLFATIETGEHGTAMQTALASLT